IEDLLAARGRIAIAWDEAAEAERPALPNARYSGSFTTMHWRQWYGAATLFDRPLIQAESVPLYLDLGFVPPANTYAYEPVPSDASPAQAARILGVHAPMWTHLARTQTAVEQLIFPRLAAVAEIGWTPPERKDWLDFTARWSRHVLR